MAQRTAWLPEFGFSQERVDLPPRFRGRPVPLFASQPSVVMELVEREEQKHYWQGELSNNNSYTGSIEFAGGAKASAQAFFCPCISYARTSARLRAALSGQDPRDLSNYHVCEPDCLQYFFCLPFSVCFVAKLQTTVRAFYDIDGVDVADWADGVFCPCLTIPRNEQEILIREAKSSKLYESQAGSPTTVNRYKSEGPMSYMPGSATPTSQISSPPIQPRTKSHDTSTLPPIPEGTPTTPSAPTSPTPKHATLSSALERPREPSSHSASPAGGVPLEDGSAIDADGMLSPTGGGKRWPLMQYLGHKWYLVPADKKENSKPTSEESSSGEVQQPAEEKSEVASRSPRVSFEPQQRPTVEPTTKHGASQVLDDLSNAILGGIKSMDKRHKSVDSTKAADKAKPADEPKTAGGDKTTDGNQPTDKSKGRMSVDMRKPAEDNSPGSSGKAKEEPKVKEAPQVKDELKVREAPQAKDGTKDGPATKGGTRTTEPTKGRFSEHLLEDDPRTPSQRGASPHRLSADTQSQVRQVDTSHPLESDVTTPRESSTSTHRLEKDPLEATRPRGLWPSGASKQAPATVTHLLDDDAPVIRTMRPVSPHPLEDDAKTTAVLTPREGNADANTEASQWREATPEAEATSEGAPAESTGSKIAKAASQFFASGAK